MAQAIQTIANKSDIFDFQTAPPRTARHNNAAKMAYSVTCPTLRIIVSAAFSVAQVIWGSSQRKNGTRNRDVCSAESTSVDPIKISAIQIIAGIQHLTKRDRLMFKMSPTLFCNRKSAIYNLLISDL